MGFLFDSLKHLLGTDADSRRRGLAGMAGRIFGLAGVELGHGTLPDDPGFGVWHFAKAGARNPRGYAVTLTIGLGEHQTRELVALTLADSREPGNDPIAALLGTMAAAEPRRGEVVSLPRGCLGRSSHVRALVTAPWPLPAEDLPEYERVLGASLDLVVPITAREADWIATHGADEYVAAMRDQDVQPWADRAPGETRLLA